MKNTCCLGLLTVLLTTVPSTVKAQSKPIDSVIRSVPGCYSSMKNADGVLTLNADRTFRWIRRDTLSGNWTMKSRFSVLVSNTATLILEHNNAKSKLLYYVDDQKLSIGKPWLMGKIPCK